MKKIIKLTVFPILTVLLLAGMFVMNHLGQNKVIKAEEANASDGLIYTDYFTGNTAHYEWQFGELSQNTKSPTLRDDALVFEGFSSRPAYAILQHTLPSKCDIYFTAEVARRGESTGRDPAVFLNVGEKFGTRYMVWFKEGVITLTHNTENDLVQKKVEDLTVGKPCSFRISLDGTTLALYMNGSKEPIFEYTATADYATLGQARNFAIYGRASEFIFDDLVITDGSAFIKNTELEIMPEAGKTVEGIGTTKQMKAFLSPINSSDKGLVWTVDNEELATITSNGLLKAKGYGKVTVTATTRDGSGLSATCKVDIKKVQGAKEEEEVNKNGKAWNLADAYSIIYESENPHFIYPMSPFVTSLKSGRIIAAFDLNGDGVNERIPVGYKENPKWMGQHVVVAYSDDEGKTWEYSLECMGLFPRVFEAGNKLYLILRDENSNLAIRYSDDDGETWSDNYVIDKRSWHSAPTNILYKGDYLYMTMELSKSGSLCPILLRAKCTDDLTKPESWSFSNEVSLMDLVEDALRDEIDYVGLPELHNTKDGLRWLEGNVFQIYDENHQWYDESMNTFYIYLRGTTGRSGYAGVIKVEEKEDGTMSASAVETENGNKQVFVAMPGGHDKFGMLYDEKTGLYWLASNFSDNSMYKWEYTSGDTQANNYMERDRLALYFSKDALNWNFAGMIAEGDSEREARAYPCIAIDGEDLLVVTRCGTEESSSLHDNNIISFHRIEDFRGLVY